MISHTARKTLATFLANAFTTALIIAILFRSIAASTTTDGSTPLALTPGAPAGSYPLSGVDNINPYNGNLNFHLPLFGVGGRGDAGYTITVPIEQHWRVNHTILSDGRELNIPVYNPWTPIDPGYGPGALYGRQVNDGSCSQSLPNAGTLTRLTFVTPDGTEHELIDKLTGGGVRTSFCSAGLGFARGTVFVSTHGAMTFVSDSPIHDNQFGSAVSFYPTGYLMLPDGTRFRIVNGRVDWLRDRNGNQVTITYPTSTRMMATDPLGRQVIVDKNVSEGAPYGLCDKITFNGFNGTQRFIRVSKTNLGSVLRSGFSLQTPAALFPQLDGSSSTNHDPQVVSAIWLPDGIRSYQFRYNSYGELARVELPTGGAFEYDYAAGLVSGYPSGVLFSLVLSKTEIYRRATEKRVYKEGGVLEHKTTISRTDSQFSNDTTVTVDKLNSGGALLNRSKHYFFGNPAQSFDVQPLAYPAWKHGREYKTEAFDTNGTTVLRRFEHTWQQPVAGSTWPLTSPETNDSVKPNNPQITQTLTTLEPATANQVTKHVFAYDQYTNKTDIWEFDFGPGAPPSYALRRTQTSFLTTNPVNSLDYASPNPTATSIHLRSLTQHRRVYSINPSNGQETEVSHTEIFYDETALNPWYGAVTQWADPGSARGNSTKVRTWLTPGGSWIEARVQFDQVGNASKAWDPKNNQSEIIYSSTYHFAYPTQAITAVPDPTGQHGSATAFVSTKTYDFSTGLVTSTTDANDEIVNVAYNDVLDRPTQFTRAVGTSSETQTTVGYNDANRTVTITSDLHNFNDNVLKSETVYDGFGRTIETRQFEGGSNYIAMKTDYDALGRPFKTSNPFRPWQSETPVWTTQIFDALGRVISVTTPDNAAVTTSYNGNTVTITDQAGKKRKSVTDALGRMTEVYEDPEVPGGPAELNYQTTYTYDAPGNLVKVTQGSQQRFFMYDSLRRLIRVRNVEQSTLASLNLADPITGNSAWSIGYQYDSNSNVIEKTDARGVVSTYAYDALNRIKTINYSDTTTINPDVKRFYDGATNGRGRFWHVYSGGDFSTGANVDHTSIDSYDALGRPLVQRQLFKLNSVWSPTYQTSRVYNRAGRVTLQTYPSGRSVTYNYDPAGRLGDKDGENLAFRGNLGDGVLRTYSREIKYSQWGNLSREQYGTNTAVYHKLRYNIRGQLCDVRASNVNDDWGGELGALVNHYTTAWAQCGSGSDNNGNVLMSQTIINSYFMEDRYEYDALNRVTAVNEWQNGSTHTARQQYGYDRWGNRTINATGTWLGNPNNPPDPLINETQFDTGDLASTNRLYAPGDVALPDNQRQMRYDAAGNLTHDTYTGAGAREYDAENRMTRAWGGNNQWQYYTYNTEGQRTRRKVDNQETWQVYGFDGELLAEYAANGAAASPQKEYGYRNGQLLITAEPATAVATNVALASNGATATASSTWSNPPFSYLPSSINNGDHRGLSAGNNSNWTSNGTSLPQWVEVAFSGSKTINQIDVFSMQDDYHNPIEPTESTTFSLYGLTAFEVQYWNGSTWVTVPGGSVSGNNKVWKKITFAPLTTTKIRVHITATSDNWSRMVEVEAWAAGPGANINWLVSDHLGSPRMIIDQTGTLGNVKRHDYLPFGEELVASVGGRSIGLGYAGVDGVRQQFTSKERDTETGLDYFGARYYGNKLGRFLSTDPLITSGRPQAPQSWNRYTYALNRPLRLVDPSGMIDQDPQKPPPKHPPTTGGLIIQEPCTEKGPRCHTLVIGTVTITGPPTPITRTDVQLVTELQILTGQEKPLPQRGATVSVLDGIADGGAYAGSAVAIPAASGPTGALGAAAAAGGVLTVAFLYDLGRTVADAISRALPQSPPDEDDTILLYRGVAVDHPGYELALSGTAVPIGGHDNPGMHNLGDTFSIYTSWTRDPRIAVGFAGSGGVLLMKNIERSRTRPSPDIFSEGEVLVIGVVTNATVTIVP